MYLELRKEHTFTSIEDPKRTALFSSTIGGGSGKPFTTYGHPHHDHHSHQHSHLPSQLQASERHANDDITEHAIRQALANKMAHKQLPSHLPPSHYHTTNHPLTTNASTMATSSRGISKSTNNIHSPPGHSKYPSQTGITNQHHASSSSSHPNVHHPHHQFVSPINETEIERKRRHNLESMQQQQTLGFLYSPEKNKDVSNSTFLETNGEIFRPKETEGTKRAPVKPLGYVSRMKTAMKHTNMFGKNPPYQSHMSGMLSGGMSGGMTGTIGLSNVGSDSLMSGEAWVGH